MMRLVCASVVELKSKLFFTERGLNVSTTLPSKEVLGVIAVSLDERENYAGGRF